MNDRIQLDSCRAFEWIVVTTRGSVYDLVVLPGDGGAVMVRGGRFFPEFRRATLTGSLVGRSAVKLRNICVGFPMELRVDKRPLITSRIEALSRSRMGVVRSLDPLVGD